jgi:flavin reductase (DIM6/NTAB) family NADH-FMN oxidoreductase RutF
MIDSRAFRPIMGCFATGVTIVTARPGDGGPIGLTVNALTSLSLDPPLVLFCLERKAHVYPLFKKASSFAVNILGAGQEDISRYFADFRHHAKPKNLWARAEGGCPLLRGTLGWMVCRKVAIHRGGDHDIFVGEVVKLKKRAGDGEPLLYFRGRYRQIKPL